MTYWSQKVAVVTGGSDGLGRAIAAALLDAGAKVVISGRSETKLQRVQESLPGSGNRLLCVPCDVTQQPQVEALIGRAVEHFGRLDILVNCAGSSARGDLLSTTAEDFQQLMDLNLLGVVRCTRAALPELLKSRGHVVNIGSLSSKSASRYMGAYAATKFAVAAYSQQLRLELADRGVHVLLVCPGPIARDQPHNYAAAGGVPKSAHRPGGGVRLPRIDPNWLSRAILRACQRRRPELVVPGRARILFAIEQLCPRLGDWIIRRLT